MLVSTRNLLFVFFRGFCHVSIYRTTPPARVAPFRFVGGQDRTRGYGVPLLFSTRWSCWRHCSIITFSTTFTPRSMVRITMDFSKSSGHCSSGERRLEPGLSCRLRDLGESLILSVSVACLWDGSVEVCLIFFHGSKEGWGHGQFWEHRKPPPKRERKVHRSAHTHPEATSERLRTKLTRRAQGKVRGCSVVSDSWRPHGL